MADFVQHRPLEASLALLRRVRSAAEADSGLLLGDFWADPTHTEPVHGAEVVGGWPGLGGPSKTRPLAGLRNLIVAEAV